MLVNMKLFIAPLLALCIAGTAIAQETLQVDITKLNQQELQVYQKLKQQQQEDQMSLSNLSPEKVDRYAQMGKGVGIAINEGLGAVTKNVEQFSQTSAGKWLMVLITWKVMGQDAIGLTRSVIQWLIGGILLLVGIPFWIWIIKRNCVNRPIASIEKAWGFTKKVVYEERSSPIHEDMTLAYGACFLVYLGCVAAITFLH